MITQRVSVKFRDGSEKEVAITQYSLGQFAMWSQARGIEFDVRQQKNALMGIAMLRYQAYAELHFDFSPKTRPSFEVWDQTVIEVDSISEPEIVNPTQTDTLDN